MTSTTKTSQGQPCKPRNSQAGSSPRCQEHPIAQTEFREEAQSEETYDVPLRPVSFPNILPAHQSALSEYGWSTLTLNPSDALHQSSQTLLQASKSFFDLPVAYKSTFKTRNGTEEGWNRVDGEKEFITLRRTSSTPVELLDGAREFWNVAGGILNEILGGAATSLGMRKELLTRCSEPCITMGEQNTATLVRLFRYEGDVGRVVSEAHCDLGLLSISLSDTPGLEVWNKDSRSWFQIERSYEGRSNGTIMVGRELEMLSSGRYGAGGHLVRAYPDGENGECGKRYRYSLIFVLRAHEEVMIDTDELRTPITGDFKEPLRGVMTSELYRRIAKAHININSEFTNRKEQREKLAEKKGMMGKDVVHLHSGTVEPANGILTG